MKTRTLPAAVALLLIAGLAWALTEQDLQDESDRLSGVYSALDTRVDACPGGTCGEAGQILSDLSAAGGELDQLAADRASLSGCSCVQVDADIAVLQAERGTQEDIVDGWD